MYLITVFTIHELVCVFGSLLPDKRLLFYGYHTLKSCSEIQRGRKEGRKERRKEGRKEKVVLIQLIVTVNTLTLLRFF